MSEGVLDVDDRQVSDLIDACRKVAEKVSAATKKADFEPFIARFMQLTGQS